MARTRRVAVLGAGIMGSSVALYLARRGVEVTLIDAAPAPFSGASRWNEGKIHLGYLYAADPTGQTAARLLPAGLAFKALTEELTGAAIARATAEDDIYLVNRASVVAPATFEDHLKGVAALVRDHADASHYIADASRSTVRRLTRREVAAIADPDRIVAGFQVTERSVETNSIADRFVDALEAQDGIVPAMNTVVRAVRPAAGADDGWIVDCAPRVASRFDAVVNALWQGGPAIDRTVGLDPEARWSHRFRLSLFIRTTRPVDAPGAVLVTGPFGDMKNYDGRHFYLSWYDAGLVAEGTAIDPPPLPDIDAAMRKRIAKAIVDRLAVHLPAAAEVAAQAEEARIEGGWVFALGEGSLADRAASLHRRDRFGVRRLATYFSVDTGKYSTAPWLARQLAEEISFVLR